MADSRVSARIKSVLEDPTVRSVARVYAVALLDAIPSGDAAAVLEEAQSFVTEVLDANPTFERLLCNPATMRDEKLRR
ncbi:MAG: hypothetical protein Q8K78_05015, partial [Planctomycetaceae bacterium]|nr:hypothetical protein [Planctomycetaceae bacterium]